MNDKLYELIASDLIKRFQSFTKTVNIYCDPILTASKNSEIRWRIGRAWLLNVFQKERPVSISKSYPKPFAGAPVGIGFLENVGLSIVSLFLFGSEIP